MPDHVHMMLSVPPKYAVSQMVGFIKGKSAMHLEKRHASGAGVWGAQAQFCRAALPDRGYFVSTAGRDEAVIREYIKHQEKEDDSLDQLGRWKRAATDGWPMK